MTAVNNSVVHLTMRFQRKVLSIGTGVLYQNESGYYIVTAWHNLSGRHSETLEPLSERSAIPDNVVVNLAVTTPGHLVTRHPLTIPLHDEERSLFYIHPKNWPRVDVAVIPFDPYESYLSEMSLSDGQQIEIRISPIMPVEGVGETELTPIQKCFVPNNDVMEKWFESVGVTEELFIPGYPHNVQDYYAQPVWKRATIASSVQNGWNREAKFLVDSASKSGMSGSPVLYYSPKGHVQIHGSTYQFGRDVAILAGIYVGRIAVKDGDDPQIRTVWHKSVIDEIIDGKCFENLPYEVELSSDELKEYMQEILATCSKEGIENIKNPDVPSRYYVRQQLMEKIGGRASPKRALEAILDAAETYQGSLVVSETDT